MIRDSVESSLLQSAGYDAVTQTLELEFKKNKPKKNATPEEIKKAEETPAPVYQYTPFTPERHAEFMAADSHGKYFLQKIKTDTTLKVTRIMEDQRAPSAPTGEVGV